MKLKGLLEGKEFETNFSQIKDDDEWVWRDLKIDEIKGSLEDIVNFVMLCIRLLEKRASGVFHDIKA